MSLFYVRKEVIVFPAQQFTEVRMIIWQSTCNKFSKTAFLKNRLATENAILHYNLGVLHLQRQEVSEAAEEFEKAIELRNEIKRLKLEKNKSGR